jgi:hypothetical protein
MKEFLAAMDAEEQRLVELIRLLEDGVIATVPPRPPVSEIIATSRLQLDGVRSLRLIYGDNQRGAKSLN